MENEKRMIDYQKAREIVLDELKGKVTTATAVMLSTKMKYATVDAYTKEQVACLIQQTEKLEAKNKELEKEVSWLKSCLNCKIRKECPRHCGKVVHDCDHWEYGDSTVDAVPVVHGRWEKYQRYVICSNCGTGWPYYKNDTDRFRYCPNCGAKMDGDGNE